MRDRADENVDRDHIAVKEDGLVDESGPFVRIIPIGHFRDKTKTADGRLINDPASSRGPAVRDTDAIGVSTEKGKKTHIVGFEPPKPMVQPTVDRGGRTGIIIRFFDSGTKLVRNEAGLRYTRQGAAERTVKKPIDDALDILMNTRAGRFLARVDTGDEMSYVDMESTYNRYLDLTTSRVIPAEMPFSNLGGPLFGDANLGWNSIFHFVFKLNTKYDGVPRLEAPRGAYWMLRGTQNIVTKYKDIEIVKSIDGQRPDIVKESIEYEEATDDVIDPNSIFPRQTFEVSWLGDGLPVELDQEEEYTTPDGKTIANPDYLYRKASGRMPVWRNIDHPQTILDDRVQLKTVISENFSKHSDTAAADEFWQDKLEWAEKFVDEEEEWNDQLDHGTLFFGYQGGNPRAARCIWKELAAGVYTMKVDALKSGYCGFDLTYPKRYKVGKAVDGTFIKPSADGTNDVAQELDLRVLQKGGNSSDLHIYLRPRVLRFAGTTIYTVVYMVLLWPYGFPVFYVDPAWPESSDPRFFTPWTNSGGHSFIIAGSQAADYYVNDHMPVPFNAALFSATHFGGIPITVVPSNNFWNIYTMEHPKKDSDNNDGVPVAVIRKFDQYGKSQLYCIYYFDDGEENPLNQEETLFSWTV